MYLYLPIKRTSVFVLACTVSLVICGIVAQDLIFTYSSVLFFCLVGYFTFQKSVNFFNPFTLFTLFYVTIIPASLYLHLSGFNKAIFLENAHLSSDPNSLLELSLLYYIAGYLSALMGYKCFVKKGIPTITFKDGISIKIVNVVIVFFVAIGLFNFCFNVEKFAGGNLMRYFSNVSVRYLEFEEFGGTTIGYIFGYTAAYLWLYKIFKTNRRSFLFFIYLPITVCMHATTGRISGTLFYALSFVCIYYLINFKENKTNNLKYAMLLAIFGFCGFLFFVFRLTSSLSYSNMLDAGWLKTISSYINFESLMFLAVDQGNIPNVSIFMQIIDSWGRDIGFLYGSSLFTWIFSMVPESIRPEGYQISVIIKNIWHAQTPGGNLPPTGIGEMYANFGVLGPFIGMFLFGCFVALIYNLLFKYNNFWYLVIYSNISLYFIMLYPKGEFDNLSLWHVVPMLVTFLTLKVLTRLSNEPNLPLTDTVPGVGG